MAPYYSAWKIATYGYIYKPTYLDHPKNCELTKRGLAADLIALNQDFEFIGFMDVIHKGCFRKFSSVSYTLNSSFKLAFLPMDR